MTVHDKQTPGYDRAIHPPSGVRVQAGIFEREGSEPHDETSGLTIADLAEIHEFGLGVPERSFIRAWFDQNQPAIVAKLRERFREAALGKITYATAAEQFSLWCEASIRARIVSHIPPPNADSTIKRKGSSTPLVDQGVLKGAITARAEVSA